MKLNLLRQYQFRFCKKERRHMAEEKCPVLYSFRRCPYAIRARMALYKAHITVELREVDLKNKPESMLDISPKGSVPVLVLTDGTVIDESLDIMKWATGQNDPDGWLNADKEIMEFLIDRNDYKFKRALDHYKYPDRYPGEDFSRSRNVCAETLNDLNTRLEQSKYLVTEHITLADIALFPFIRQCAFTDQDWFAALPYPRLQEWLDDYLDSPLFKAIMAKFKAWAPDDPPVLLMPTKM